MANHVLMFPFYVQGHLPPMLELAELLSNNNIRITFIINNFYNFPARTRRSLEYYSGLPNFRFHTLNIPREEPHKSLHELIGQEESRRVSCKDEYRRILVGPIDDGDDGWPRVTCVVADSFVSLALDVPEELGIPIMILHPANAACLWFYYCMPAFLEANDFPFQGDSDYDKEVHGIPGMKGILRRRDLPDFVTKAKSKNDQVLQYILTTGINLSRAKALIVHTIEALELPILSCIRSVFPAAYTVAPVHKLVDLQLKQDIIKNDQVDGTNNNCLTWLDSQRVKSVVYVSFGSTARLSKDELVELWHGLVDSGYPFLWVVRKGLLIGSEDDDSSIKKLLEEEEESVLDATKKRGCIVEWAPQKEVLEHPSVECYVTHGGWNSILESIDGGVPMICWPFSADQQMNCRLVVQVWKIGLDISGPMQRSVVDKAVKEVMDGDGAREMRRSVALLSKVAKQSVESGGSSSTNLEALVQHVLSFGV